MRFINILLLAASVSILGSAFMQSLVANHKAKAPVGPLYASSVVRLTNNGQTFCSGVVINKDTIVTAGHCVITWTPFGGFLRPEPIEVRSADNKFIAMARVKGATVQLDRGVIKGDFKSVKPAIYISDVARSIATRAENQQYYVCGFPLGGPLYCGKAIYLKNWGFQVAVKGVLIPGMSGGPMMLDNGAVVGINSAVIDDFSVISPIYNIDSDL